VARYDGFNARGSVSVGAYVKAIQSESESESEKNYQID
jgi:hypothetical protein